MNKKEDNKKEKYNYITVKLRQQQEAFVDCIMEGKSYYESYITAYPRSKKWTRNAIQVAVNHMMENENIKAKLAEYGWRDKTKIYWTRQKALETINYVMDMNRKDMERIEQAYEDEIQILNAQIMECSQAMVQETNPQKIYSIAKQMQELTAEIALRNKQRRTNSTNARGIYEGAKILNRMFGCDITKVEISNTDEEREEMEKLSAEELKELINISKKED